MGAMRGPQVVEDPSFIEDKDALRTKYPEIDAVVADFSELLR